MKPAIPQISIRRIFPILLLPLLPCILSAQQANSVPEDAGQDDEVIVLDEFSVSARSLINEYVASEAISGTRTGAKIVENPFHVQVLTADLIEDFQLMNEYNQLPTVPNYTPDDSGKLRGFTPLVLRDGFSRAGPSNFANTKSIEVIMGPQSALYGRSSPGGILNYISKRPQHKSWNRLTLSAGNYDYQRVELELNGPAIPQRLYYLFNASYYHRDNVPDYTETENWSYQFGLSYVIIPKTTLLTVNWEQQFSYPVNGAGAPKYIVGSARRGTNNDDNGTGYFRKQGRDIGPYKAVGTFNRLGPYQDNYSRFDNFTALIDHKFSPVFSARVNMLYYHRQWNDKTWTSGLQFDETSQRMWSREPMKRLQTIDNYAIQTDFLSQFRTGPLSHKLLFAADYNRDVYDNQMWQLPSSGTYAPREYLSATNIHEGRPLIDTRFLDPFDPLWFTPDYGLVTRYTANLKRVYDHFGATASLRSFALHQNLITSLSSRYSYTKADIRNRMTPADSGKSTEDGWTYSFGMNYKIAGDGAVFYANIATSYEPSVTYDKGLRRTIAAETGKGFETGMKGMLLDGKINYTFSLFHIEKKNVRESNPSYVAGTGIPQYITAGEIRARGIELVSTIIPRRSFTITTSFGYTDAEITHDDPQNNPSTIGERPLYVPRLTASMLTSYGFQNNLFKGLKINMKLEFTSDRVSQHQDEKTYTTDSKKDKFITPSLFLMSAGFSYEIKQSKRIKHSFSLQVQNLLNKDYLTATYAYGRGCSYSATYRFYF